MKKFQVSPHYYWEDLIIPWLTKQENRLFDINDIFTECLGIPVCEIQRADQIRVSAILQAHGCKQTLYLWRSKPQQPMTRTRNPKEADSNQHISQEDILRALSDTYNDMAAYDDRHMQIMAFVLRLAVLKIFDKQTPETLAWLEQHPAIRS